MELVTTVVAFLAPFLPYLYKAGEGAAGESSAKWVHVDFQSNVPANGETVYTLKHGSAPKGAASALQARIEGHTATVVTGPLKFTVTLISELIP